VTRGYREHELDVILDDSSTHSTPRCTRGWPPSRECTFISPRRRLVAQRGRDVVQHSHSQVRTPRVFRDDPALIRHIERYLAEWRRSPDPLRVERGSLRHHQEGAIVRHLAAHDRPPSPGRPVNRWRGSRRCPPARDLFPPVETFIRSERMSIKSSSRYNCYATSGSSSKVRRPAAPAVGRYAHSDD
jgi:hypothetical protein